MLSDVAHTQACKESEAWRVKIGACQSQCASGKMSGSEPKEILPRIVAHSFLNSSALRALKYAAGGGGACPVSSCAPVDMFVGRRGAAARMRVSRLGTIAEAKALAKSSDGNFSVPCSQVLPNSRCRQPDGCVSLLTFESEMNSSTCHSCQCDRAAFSWRFQISCTRNDLLARVFTDTFRSPHRPCRF